MRIARIFSNGIKSIMTNKSKKYRGDGVIAIIRNSEMVIEIVTAIFVGFRTTAIYGYQPISDGVAVTKSDQIS